MKIQTMQGPIAATQPPVPGSINDWGIALAILLYLAREGLSWVKRKDSDEAALTSTLVNDLRRTNQELLTNQAIANQQLAAALQQIGEACRQQVFTNSEVLAEVRALRDQIVLQGAQCKDLHSLLNSRFAA